MDLSDVCGNPTLASLKAPSALRFAVFSQGHLWCHRTLEIPLSGAVLLCSPVRFFRQGQFGCEGQRLVTPEEKALISVEGLFWPHIIKTIPVKKPTNKRPPPPPLSLASFHTQYFRLLQTCFGSWCDVLQMCILVHLPPPPLPPPPPPKVLFS